MPVSREPRPQVRAARRAARRMAHEHDRAERLRQRPTHDRYGNPIPYAPVVR